MSRRTYVFRNGKLVELERNYQPTPRIHIISDHMERAYHPCESGPNRRPIDSKAAFRAITRAHDCIEVGDQAHRPIADMKELPPIEQDLAEAVQKVEQGYKPKPLESLEDWNKNE